MVSEQLLIQGLADVDLIIKEALQSDVELIQSVSNYSFQKKGKRIRTKLSLLACLQQGPLHEAVLYNAAAIELLHTATLLHDDVIDGSQKRRARQSANMLWGNSAAVLSGDFLYSVAFQLLVKTKSITALAQVAQGARDITEAEVWQLSSIGNLALSEDEYVKIISGKTAALFAVSMSTGTLLGGGNSQAINQARLFGHHLGIAFQLTDDYLDYCGLPPTWTKEPGDDLSEAKITYPLITFLRSCDNDQNRMLQEMFAVRDKEDLRAHPHFAPLCEAIQNKSAVGNNLQNALTRSHLDQAIAIVRKYFSGEYQETFLRIADQIETRTH